MPAVTASLLALLQGLSFAHSMHSGSGGDAQANGSAGGAAVQPPEAIPAGDWAGIREAYEASRHAFAATDDGFAARSPRNGWISRFDGQGFTLAPAGGDWSFGLELERFGFAGSEHVLDAPFQACAAGQRLTYDWSADVSEWWINDGRGLEHGFTVHRAPEGEGDRCEATLMFDLAVRGALEPSVTSDRRGVQLVDASNATVLTYDGLIAFDADGALLEAWLEVVPGRLRIAVRVDGARYPITVDPVVQAAYVKASNTGAGDFFGHAVGIDGDTVVVGAYGEDSNATGVNGAQDNAGAVESGAAYVFVRTGSTWSQQAYLKASNTGASDQFGHSVAISEDTVLVGAKFEDSNATGVNGVEGNNSALDSGAAYVFVRTGTTWSQQAYLKASNTGAGDRFGQSVAISGDTIVVGADAEDSNATGVNGAGANNSAADSGAGYVFVRTGTTWSQQAYLKASNTGASDFFGVSVTISGDTTVVGAYTEDSNATGVDGDQANNSAADSGAAYVFIRTGTAWSQQAYLKASNTAGNDQFGATLAISEDTVVAGARFEDSSATGVNGDQLNDSALNSGSAYVFARAGSTWSQQAYLKASNTGANDQFGNSVAIAGGTVVVGANREGSNATGVNGNQADNSAFASGAAYVFMRVGATWSQQAYLKASNTGLGDDFGSSVSVAGGTVVVGAREEDSNATGVNGDQTGNSASNAGAVYVFDLIAPGTIGTNFCHPFSLNSSGVAATITATGSTAVLDADVTLTVSGLPTAGTTAMLINSMSASATINAPAAGGMGGVPSDGRICIGGGHFGRHFYDIYMGNAGTFNLALDLLDMPFPEAPGDYSRIVLVGETWFWQCWYRDGALGAGRSNFSDAVAITFE